MARRIVTAGELLSVANLYCLGSFDALIWRRATTLTDSTVRRTSDYSILQLVRLGQLILQCGFVIDHETCLTPSSRTSTATIKLQAWPQCEALNEPYPNFCSCELLGW